MKQLERLYLPAVACLALVVLSGAGLLALRSLEANDGIEIVINTPSPESLRIQVSITGAVLAPGVYTLQRGDTVQDAVEAAGGTAAGAATNGLNPAAAVRNGDQLHVPTEAELPQKVNINTAEAWLLKALPGVGDELAQRIVDYRAQNGPFSRIEDLTRVAGVGPETLDQIRDLIAVR